MDRIANQRKVPKWLPFKNYKSKSLNILCTCTRDIFQIFSFLFKYPVVASEENISNI